MKFWFSRIIDTFNLKPVNIYCESGKILAKFEKYNGISQLVGCIKRMGASSETLNNMCDEMLTTAVATLSKANCSGTKVEDLIKLISDRPTKVSITLAQSLGYWDYFSLLDFSIHWGQATENCVFFGGEIQTNIGY